MDLRPIKRGALLARSIKAVPGSQPIDNFDKQTEIFFTAHILKALLYRLQWNQHRQQILRGEYP